MRNKGVQITEVGFDPDGSYNITISTEGVDRDGDVIMANGWDFDNYLKNPVVLLNHNYNSVPIGVTNSIKQQDGNTIVNFSFREPANEHDSINEVRAAWDQGAFRSASVGFNPLEAEPLDKDNEGGMFAPMRFTKQELLEWSIVTIPANPDALRRMVKGAIKTELPPPPIPVIGKDKQDISDEEVALIQQAAQMLNDYYDLKEG